MTPPGYTGTFLCTVTDSTTFTYVLANDPRIADIMEGMYYPFIDLSKLTLNDFIASGRSAVVVIVDPADNNLKNIVLGSGLGEGFYYPESLPIDGTYADKDDLENMAQDQIGKLEALRIRPDDEMFMLSWTLTQQTVDVMGTPFRS